MKNITLFNQVNLLQSFCKRMATATTSCVHSYKRYYLLLTILLFVGVNNAWAVDRIYLKLDAWKNSNARYAARFYNDNSKEYWQNMYETSISQVYACDIPTDGVTYNKVIFVRLNPDGSDSSNGGNNWTNKWNQSGDITFQKNKLCTQGTNWDGWSGTWSTITWYITGSFNDWKTNNSATSYTLNANTPYEFKVYSPQVGYFSNTGSMERGNHSNWDMFANVGNCTLTTDIAGTYIFTYNGDKMNVTYPEDCYLPGTFNGWAENAASSLKSGSVTLNLAANTTYTFKIHNFGATSASWHGNTGTMTRNNCTEWTMDADANCKITTDFAGDYTFTYDRSTQKLTVKYPAAYTVTYGVGTNKGTDKVTTDPSISSGSLVLASTSITFSKGETKAGYQWKNWNSNANGTGTNLGTNATYTSSNRNANTTVYACYDLITYNITYNLNGGTGATNTTYNVESSITLPTPTKTGYTFAGWYENGNKVTQIPQGSTGDKTFYANWTANTYTITLDQQGGKEGTESVKATYGEIMPPITSPTRTGYAFGGYYSKQKGEGTRYYKNDGTANNSKKWDIADNSTLYAKWTANEYTVKFNANGGEGSMGDQPLIYDIEQALSANQFTRDGYSFAGWKDKDGKSYVDKQVVKNLTDTEGGQRTLYAQWRPNVSITGTYHFFPGETINLKIATPDDGVIFTYQWQKLVGSDWTDIPGATATTYIKAEAKEEDAGHYRCVVSASGYTDAFAEYDVKCLQLYVYYDNKSDVFDTPLKKVDGATATIDVELQNAGYTYYFKITDGCGNWYGFDGDIHSEWCTDVEMNADAYCGLKTTKFGTYVFSVNYFDLTKLTVSVLYPPAYQAADKVIYLDNDVLKWTNSNNAEGKNKIYYRIGRSNHNNKHEMKLVPGTANLYKVTTHEYDNFEVWHLANNGCWSEDYSIFKTKTGDEWAATQATAFETLPVTSDVVTVTPTDLRSVGGDENNNNCEFYNYDITEGMKTWKAQVVEPTNGTITVQYTHHDGTPVNNFTSGDRDDLAHTCLLTITATPDAGYSLASLTVNDVPFTSGKTHTLTEDATIEATFTINTYTVTWKLNGGQWQGGGTEDRVCNYKYGAEVPKPVAPSRTGYTFTGWSPAEIPSTMPAEHLEFIAQWTPTPHTVTWKLGGGNYHTSNVDIENPLTAAPENPSDEALGCCADKFMGWSSQQSPSAGEIFTKDNIPANVTTDQIYYAVFATTAQGVGTSVADFSEMGYENGTAVTDPIILGDGEGHGDATITLAKAQSSSNAPTYYTAGEAVRIYAGGTITIASSYHIKNVTFTFASGDGSNEITANSGTYADGVWTENVESPTNNLIITIGGEAGQHRRIASITVTTGVTGSQYTNYVTQCTTLPYPALSGGSVPAIAVNCGDFSTLSNSQAIVFSTMQDLTCPVTFEVIDGDFLISTAKDRAAQYQSKVKVVPYKTGENTGKLKNVYVRANATDHNENFTGTLKVTSDEIGELEIPLTATVNCSAFTLTTVDHLGNVLSTAQYYAGVEITKRDLDEPASDACSENYTFDGWSTEEVAYGSLIYNKVSFPYTMPATDVTLYPVYQCNKTADYHRVTSDLGANNWAGDYLIAYSPTVFADGRNGGMNEQETMGYANVKVDLSNYISNDIVSGTIGDTYNVALVPAEGGGYLLQTKDKKYNYFSNNNNNGLNANTMASMALPYAMSIDFISENEINMKLSGDAIGSVFRCRIYGGKTYFRFCQNGATSPTSNKPIYLYKKSPLYTTSLICGTIEIQESDIVVTSTKDQSVKVSVPVKLTSHYKDAVAISGANVNSFSVISKENVPVNTDEVVNVELVYSPQAYDQLDTETITLTATNGANTSFQVTGRSLPEIFAIVAKVGNNWYALPSQGLNSETTPVGYPIEVDNNDNPTAVTSLPTKAEWELRNVYKVNGPYDRFAANGENLVFVNAENKTLYANNGNANIQTYAEYSNYATNNPNRYEWVPTTTDLVTYTLKNVGHDKNLSINVNATFGTHASNIASNNLRFLPINATYNPFDMQVVEWYPTKVLVQTEAALTSVSATVGCVAVASPVVTKKGGKLYEISGLPLENNPTKILTISYDSYSCSKVIPIIISREEKTVTDAPFSTLTTSAYNYSDLVVRDGATLTINGTKQAPDKFVNVTIYPTAKIVVPENTRLNVYSLTFIGGITEVYDGSNYTLNKYAVPELSLKGNLGKTVTSMDYVMRVDLDQMYQMGVPYDVALSDITYGDGSPIELGTQLYVSAYDGQARANRESKTWVYETDFATKFGSATLKAGVGYTISAEPQTNGDKYAILRLPMKSNISSGSTEAAKTVAVKAYDNQKGVTITDNHKGWNYLSNPYMTSISGGEADTKLVLGYLKETGTGPWEWVETTQRYVTIPMDNGKDYYQKKFSEAALKPFKSFFVQIATDGEMSFALTSRQNAPARYMEVQTEQEVEFEILLGNEKQADNTGLLIAEQYSPAYEINADLEKMTGSMSVYTIYGGHKLAYNALSPSEAKEWIPMGYIVPTTGEYTFELDEQAAVEDIVHIYLIDYETGAITDLLDNTYTFDTSVKKSESRFAINVVLRSDAPGTATGIDNMRWNSDQPQKFIYNGMMYILHNRTIYDANGQQVKTINK